MVAPLSDVPHEGSSVFSLFSLIKLHQTRGAPLNVDSGMDDTAVDMNDMAAATTEGCCTNSLPAARAAVYLFLYRARTLSQQPRAFDRAML